jgi:hypothetical protein
VETETLSSESAEFLVFVVLTFHLLEIVRMVIKLEEIATFLAVLMRTDVD